MTKEEFIKQAMEIFNDFACPVSIRRIHGMKILGEFDDIVHLVNAERVCAEEFSKKLADLVDKAGELLD